LLSSLRAAIDGDLFNLAQPLTSVSISSSSQNAFPDTSRRGGSPAGFEVCSLRKVQDGWAAWIASFRASGFKKRKGRQMDLQRTLQRLGRRRKKSRRPALQRIWPLGIATIGGAGMMFLFDPSAGHRRRALARDRTAGSVRHGWHRAERFSVRAQAGLYGLQRKAFYAWRPAEPVANDQMLTDRVLSILYRDRDISEGHLNINVEEGVVVLRGQLDRADQIRHVEDKVKKVPGVTGIRSYLHLPATPAPNKLDALRAD
jgi:hypothetical protein